MDIKDTLDGTPKINDTVRFIVRSVMIFLLIFFMIVGGCTMHSNTFDEERIKANAELERAAAEKIKASNEAKMEQVKAIERLVQNGTDPVAARCAVQGWRTGDTVCLMATGKASSE